MRLRCLAMVELALHTVMIIGVLFLVVMNLLVISHIELKQMSQHFGLRKLRR